MAEKIRSFIAIHVSQEVLQACKQTMDSLRPLTNGVKWVRPESIHLTLKFLGHITEQELHQVNQALQEIAPRYHSFQLQTAGVGCFPSPKKPRVLWVGIQGDVKILQQIQQEIEDELARLHFPVEERGFSPHLTLGRVKDARKIGPLMEKFENINFPQITFKVEKIYLMKSTLTREGAQYNILNAYPLKTED